MAGAGGPPHGLPLSLYVGIGGGGDCAGAYAVAQSRWGGGEAIVGGVTWERRPIDPLPGPRHLHEIEHADPLVDGAVLAGPETSGPGGFRFAESHLARVIAAPVLLVDPNGGPRAIAATLDAAAAALDCDTVVLVDVGGDVLAHGDEAGLASPLCDSVMLAASAFMQTRVIGAVIGAGCDGELKPAEVMERISEVGFLGAWGLTPAAAESLETAIAAVPTEASAMVLRAFRGDTGKVEIREGRRTVDLSPVAAVTFFYDCAKAIAGPARLAKLVLDAESLQAAEDILAAQGIRTEWAYEDDMARGNQ